MKKKALLSILICYDRISRYAAKIKAMYGWVHFAASGTYIVPATNLKGMPMFRSGINGDDEHLFGMG